MTSYKTKVVEYLKKPVTRENVGGLYSGLLEYSSKAIGLSRLAYEAFSSAPSQEGVTNGLVSILLGIGFGLARRSGFADKVGKGTNQVIDDLVGLAAFPKKKN